MSQADAIVVGAGHNGLIAAILLADAGWDVTVLERNDYPGGAVRTAAVTEPGFQHDVYAANLNLFVGSAFFAEYGERLFAHGFGLVPASHPFASVFPDGSVLGVSTDAEETLAGLRQTAPEDVAAWQELSAWFGEVAPTMFGVLGSPMPSRASLGALWGQRSVVRRDWSKLGRMTLQSTREFTAEHFDDPKVRSLVASWGMHLDFGPDVAGGAPFALLETFAAATHGMALGAGGAGVVGDSLASLFESLGGRIELDCEVERIESLGGGRSAVHTSTGERFDAKRAVIANVTPGALFGRLVAEDELPSEFGRAIGNYRYGPGTMMVHLALDEAPSWTAPDAGRYSYVHIAPYVDDMSLAYQQAMAGLLPERPTIVVGQPTVFDPSRAPDGKHILWIQVRAVPAEIRGDAVGVIDSSDWDEVKEGYADRVLAIVEEYADGLGAAIRGRHVISPVDLERANPSLVGGDHLGGSHHLDQHFAFRPAPGYSRYRTPIDGLYMCGAGTWPGGGLGGGSGYMLGKDLTRRRGDALARKLGRRPD